ncbi:hypothetical protein VdG1_02920 [Verticillium dahliae VDG1]|nr:hypothetical protein VdG1_02920 [Verticillium dahliae VDG1]
MASTSKPQTPRLPLDISEIESSSDPERDSEDSSAEDETPTIVRSPTKLTYKIDRLSDETRSTVREAFKDPPRLSLQYCRLQDDTYAFQMTEMVPRSIRIGSSESKFPTPRCSCGKQNGPCKHLLWLLDQLVKQTLYDQDPASPLTMTSKGFAEEFGDPFSSISDFHLDVLADSLRCRVVHPDSGNDDDDDDDDDDEDLDPSRVQEARELLASVAAVYPEEYREDIFTDPTPGTNIIKRRDLECTIFRMLLDNNDFFHYFLSRARSSDPIKDPFNKLEQRVRRVLRDLDAYSARPDTTSSSSPSREGPRNVAWAARHILGVTTLINTTIFKRDTPLTLKKPARSGSGSKRQDPSGGQGPQGRGSKRVK